MNSAGSPKRYLYENGLKVDESPTSTAAYTPIFDLLELESRVRHQVRTRYGPYPYPVFYEYGVWQVGGGEFG